MLEQRNDRSQNHGDQPGGGDDHKPLRRARKDGPHPRHQENPRLHHRGRMQIGRDGRRGSHRVRQPEMEWELGGFGETAQQDQDQRRHIKRIRLDQLAVLQNDTQVIAAHDLAQDQHAANHRQPAHAGDSQCHPCALTAFGQMLPIADQQEGRQRSQFPEDQQKQDIVAQDYADHRTLEEQQIGEKLTHIILAAQVLAPIGDDQKAYAKDQHGKEKA